MGDVVEYPLRELERDGRDKGVGLLVGRNMDRGDAATLPAETLDLCEIEPLRQEEEGSTRYDGLGKQKIEFDLMLQTSTEMNACICT